MRRSGSPTRFLICGSEGETGEYCRKDSALYELMQRLRNEPNQIFRVTFHDGIQLDVDVVEFGENGIGATLDHLAVKHGRITGYEVRLRVNS